MANSTSVAVGDNETMQTDPRWRDQVPFYEYFHGETGEGLGAAHQTGWTSLVANLLKTLSTENRCTVDPRH